MTSAAVTLYRVVDPIENFKIKIEVREISRLSSQTEEEYIPFKRTAVLHWQEKIHGPVDVADYIKHKKDNHLRGTPSQLESRKEIADLHDQVNSSAGGTTATSIISGGGDEKLLSSTMLYTYTDRDHFRSAEGGLLINSNGAESYVGEALHRGHEHSDSSSSSGNASSMSFLSRAQKVEKRESKGLKFKSMHICLATDVDVKAILSDHSHEALTSLSEHVLCSLRLYQDGN